MNKRYYTLQYYFNILRFGSMHIIKMSKIGVTLNMLQYAMQTAWAILENFVKVGYVGVDFKCVDLSFNKLIYVFFK